MLFDTHTHLEGFARKKEMPMVVGRARQAGLSAMVAIGTDIDDWTVNRKLTTAYPGLIHYTVGLHPCNVGEDWPTRVVQLESFWLVGPPPVALGEIGLDRFHLPHEDAAAIERIMAWQKEAFAMQLALAKRLGCPVVVHSRGAFAECVAMVDASGMDWSKVVFHCFSEGPDEIRELARRGGTGSFTGIITFKSAEAIRAAAKVQGLGRLLIETDAPYLAPVPYRGKPNEPCYLKHTAEYCARLFEVKFETLAEVTAANAKQFFGL